ncbi:hypothetical protein SLE2022_160600 [Rubroshorea leprosula]
MICASISMDLLSILSILLSLATLVCSQNFDVTKYGATGDGKSDDSQAFIKAWKDVCGSTSKNPTLIIPEGKTYLLNPIKFEGPCKSAVAVQIGGNIVAPSNSEPVWKETQSKRWIAFSNVKGLEVSAKGKLDARGADWWRTCPDMKGCNRPTTLEFGGCSSFRVHGLTSVNSGRNHISISGCNQGTLSSITLIAPNESPNTDGFNIASSANIEILDSNIGTGDDCIAINNYSSYINITGVACGPGHGISVGSLGINGEEAKVEEIHVKNCSFTGTDNGARIKTWQGGKGYASKISFEEIEVTNSSNPIIIDQYYCPHSVCDNQTSAVTISDVTFRGIRGTVRGENAINLHCSEKVACTNILVEDINLNSLVPDKKAYSSCTNAYGRSSRSTPPIECLLKQQLKSFFFWHW